MVLEKSVIILVSVEAIRVVRKFIISEELIGKVFDGVRLLLFILLSIFSFKSLLFLLHCHEGLLFGRLLLLECLFFCFFSFLPLSFNLELHGVQSCL